VKSWLLLEVCWCWTVSLVGWENPPHLALRRRRHKHLRVTLFTCRFVEITKLFEKEILKENSLMVNGCFIGSVLIL